MSSIDLWYATRATGIATLLLLSATMLLGILVAGRARGSAPGVSRAAIHQRLSLLSVVFLGIHILTSVLDTYVKIGWAAIVVPFASSYGRLFIGLGTLAIDLLVAVVVSSALRQRISAAAWRLVHWLAYMSWPLAVVHAIGMGTDMKLDWVRGLVAACIAGVLGAAAWRLVASLRSNAPHGPRSFPVRRSLRTRIESELAS